MQIREIRDLLFKNIFGEPAPHEERALEEWLSESEVNGELYDRLHSTPFLEKAITDDDRPLRRRVWAKIERRMAAGKRRMFRRRAMRIAAVAAIPLAAGIVWLSTSPAHEPVMALLEIRPGSPKVVVTLPDGEEMMFGERQRVVVMRDGTTTLVNEGNTVALIARDDASASAEYTAYKIPRGGEYAIRLCDGTMVHMNSESELRAPAKFGDGRRVVYFSGEGYFEVAKDAASPFIVSTALGDVEVTGTEFNVRAYEDDKVMYTTLVSGAVNIDNGRGVRVPISPGMQSAVSENGGIVVRTVDVYPYTAWKSGRIVFENARTEDIMKVLRRWYNCDVYYSDDAVRERRFTMDILKYDGITEILDLMSMVNVCYEIKGNSIYLFSR